MTEPSPNPVVVEVTRGTMVESRHRAAAAVVDAAGTVVLAVGDIERPVYPRSAIKPLQALALVESGAAEHFALGDAELALACASHSGEPRHVAIVRSWLARIGLAETDLACGPQAPLNQAASRALAEAPGPVHNNCSGKHAGFLTVARHLGHPTEGYAGLEHPVQQRVLGIVEQMTGLELGQAPRGIDGCGVPVLGVPLGNLATAMARFGRADALPDHRAAAALRIRQAMVSHPFMVAGSGRFGTEALRVLGRSVCLKTGAEGVFMAALPDLGLGLALKIMDGAGRAAEVAVLRLLDRLGVLDAGQRHRLAGFATAPVTNRAGDTVGEIRIAADGPL
jgi:L-asparaginase II